MDAYAAAYLTDGSPLAADAVTLSPYLGVGALSGAIDLALSQGRGVYVLT
jgi:orotidine-5'-phosphate decarboxylase